MCTWAVVESVDYFMRNNSDIYMCSMDMRKAFPSVKHSLLFTKLVKLGISLLTVYSLQVANVRWNGEIFAGDAAGV